MPVSAIIAEANCASSRWGWHCSMYARKMGAHDNGIIPDDVPWADPFSRMRLEEDDPEREPFTAAELRLLFATPVFMNGERPIGGRGEAAFWLPLLGLFSGARQSELASLSVSDVRTDEASTVAALFITRDRT